VGIVSGDDGYLFGFVYFIQTLLFFSGVAI